MTPLNQTELAHELVVVLAVEVNALALVSLHLTVSSVKVAILLFLVVGVEASNDREIYR